MQKENIAILISALNPRENMINIVKQLKDLGFNNIIVIDDGSNNESKRYFAKAKEEFGIQVITHKANKGKGASIKDGIKYVKEKTNFDGIITMDCDGQHLVEDVEKIAANMDKESIILGCRDFNKKNVPLRSKVGNKFSIGYLKIVSGKLIKDTQTGLRGIPRKYYETSIKTDGNRYEYEMNILLKWCKDKSCNIKSVPIETVYEKDNISYFNPIRDSIIIYKDFFKNTLSSLFCALIDIVVFGILLGFINVFWSNIISRIISGIFDFGINKYWVFKSGKSFKGKKEFSKYVILFIIQMLLNTTIVTLLSLISKHIILIKIIVNTVLYFISYFSKKRFVF